MRVMDAEVCQRRDDTIGSLARVRRSGRASHGRPSLRRRFNLRTQLIATTLVAMVLGIVVVTT